MPVCQYAGMQVCQYCRNPRRTPAPLGPFLHLHWQLAAGICRDFLPEFWRILAAGAWRSILNSDADWAQNILNRKLISGIVFTLAGAAICWISKKQPTVALSSMEGEYMALSLAVRHGLWIKMFFEELGFPLESTLSIYTDNTAAIALAHDPQFHARSKHIDTRHHFLRKHVTRKTIELSHIPGDENLADLFTKALPRPRFNYLASKVMGRRT
ncbi:Copia-like polyprotein/retrotransposon [Ceratobasidium sp. AG-Ba]|nr:Copia-like polyprotein/retrotransposon [Ceratobasidium sp. AG-Ba]